MDTKYTFKFTETLTVSSDLDERQAKQGTAVEVLFVFENWTAQELADRLMSSNSPKVSVAAILRKMKVIPSTYTYNVTKAGQRGQADPIQTLLNKYGDVDAVIAMLEARRKGN